MSRPLRLVVHGSGLLMALTLLACAGAPRPAADDYLRYVWFEVPGNEKVHLRWLDGSMPLRVHLPTPTTGLFADPETVLEVVRDGITDWTDVAGAGIPSFVFVDDAGDADIPIVWEAEPSGDWYIAHCVYDLNLMQRRFGIAHILVTARYAGREQVPLQQLYETVLHEMGHALGLSGHSPYESDIMYFRGTGRRRPTASACATEPHCARSTRSRTATA